MNTVTNTDDIDDDVPPQVAEQMSWLGSIWADRSKWQWGPPELLVLKNGQTTRIAIVYSSVEELNELIGSIAKEEKPDAFMLIAPAADGAVLMIGQWYEGYSKITFIMQNDKVYPVKSEDIGGIRRVHWDDEDPQLREDEEQE